MMFTLMFLMACEPAPIKPSLLVLTVNGLRADRVGAYGHLPTETPNIDALAKDGTVFLRAYATSTSAAPALESVRTGYVPPVHGLRLGGPREALKAQVPRTVAGWLAELSDLGWSLCSQSSANLYTDKSRFELGNCISNPGVVTWVEMDVEIENLGLGMKARDYDAAIHKLDEQVGKIRTQWTAKHPHSLIFLMGVTGALAGARADAALLLTDDLLRVPLIVHGPGIDAGWEVGHVVSTMDVGATVLGLFGLKSSGGGVSLFGSEIRPVYHESTEGYRLFNARPMTGFSTESGRYAEGVFGRWYPAYRDIVRPYEDPVSEHESEAKTLKTMRASFGGERGLPETAWASFIDPVQAVGWAERLGKIEVAMAKGHGEAAVRMFEGLKAEAPKSPALEALGRRVSNFSADSQP